MRVFVGMETSGMVRRAFQSLGHEVVSCDLLPADDGEDEDHYQGDVFHVVEDLMSGGWIPDLGIFHPECTYHTVAAAWAFGDGPYHQKVRPGTLVGEARRRARLSAEQDLERIRLLPIGRKVIENPKGTIPTRTKLGAPSQVIQPYQFGEDASKATCLWFFDAEGRALPWMRLPIDPALYVEPRLVPSGKTGRLCPRWANQTDSGQNRLSPSDDRWKDRSKTYAGIASAFAQAWGRPSPYESLLLAALRPAFQPMVDYA